MTAMNIFFILVEGNTVLDKLSIGFHIKINLILVDGRQQNKIEGIDELLGLFLMIQFKRKKERPHPATFPINLPEMCIKLHGIKEKMVVMDPFLGIGSSAIASNRLGVSFIGFEIDKANFLKPLKGIPFPIVIKTFSGFSIIPFDKENEHDRYLLKILKIAMDKAIRL